MDQNDDLSISEDNVREAILSLAEDGVVYGSCPVCRIPMLYHELNDSKCSSCGEIDFDSILFSKNSNKC
jgi:exosome complex RNA-binding protein Csl4